MARTLTQGVEGLAARLRGNGASAAVALLGLGRRLQASGAQRTRRTRIGIDAGGSPTRIWRQLPRAFSIAFGLAIHPKIVRPRWKPERSVRTWDWI